MHVTFAAVVSLDGKITRGDEPNVHAWSSAEDWQHFVQLRDQHDSLVMDRLSYEAVRPQPSPNLLRIVLTHHPERYADQTVPGQLEFMAATPTEVIAVLQKQSRTRLLVAGGSTVGSSFFSAGLVDEVYLTMEPYMFGAGKPLLAPELLTIRLHLEDIRRLNENGTLLLHYTVMR